MAFTLNAPSMDIGSVFRFHLAIPDTQRDFAWDRENVETFFEDLMDEGSLNYLGLFIFWYQEELSTKKDPYYIYDGQQRITSFFILLICIKQKLEKIRTEEKLDANDPDYKSCMHEVERVIISTNDHSFIPAPSIKDLLEYMTSFKFKWDGEFPIKEKNAEGKSIQLFKAETKAVRPIYNSFMGQLTDFTISNLSKLTSRIINSECIVLKLKDFHHANNVFRRVNATGKSLDMGDLIKNEIIGPAEGKDRANVTALWNELTNKSFDNPTLVIRYQYMATNGHITNRDLISKLKKNCWGNKTG